MNRPHKMFALMCAAVLGCAILPASAQQAAPSEPLTLPTLPERQPPTMLRQGHVVFADHGQRRKPGRGAGVVAGQRRHQSGA